MEAVKVAVGLGTARVEEVEARPHLQGALTPNGSAFQPDLRPDRRAEPGSGLLGKRCEEGERIAGGTLWGGGRQ